MAVGVADVEFADVPGAVGGRHSDLDVVGEAVLMDGVDVIDPDRHPDAFVVVVGGEGFGVRAFAAAALSVMTKEDLDRAALDRSKTGGLAPIPDLFPSKPLEPGDALGEVRHVQYRRCSVRDHGENSTANCGKGRE